MEIKVKTGIKDAIVGTMVFLSMGLCSCSNPSTDTDSEIVYICVSSTSYAYHIDEYCQRLQRCTHEIKKVSWKNAEEKYRRKPCNWCTNPTVLNPK